MSYKNIGILPSDQREEEPLGAIESFRRVSDSRFHTIR